MRGRIFVFFLFCLQIAAGLVVVPTKRVSSTSVRAPRALCSILFALTTTTMTVAVALPPAKKIALTAGAVVVVKCARDLARAWRSGELGRRAIGALERPQLRAKRFRAVRAGPQLRYLDNGADAAGAQPPLVIVPGFTMRAAEMVANPVSDMFLYMPAQWGAGGSVTSARVAAAPRHALM